MLRTPSWGSTYSHLAAAIWHTGFFKLAGEQSQIGLSFAIGFVPDLFLSALIAKFPWIRLRRVSEASKTLQEELPLLISP